jgi:SAM-dependent methyltransferase
MGLARDASGSAALQRLGRALPEPLRLRLRPLLQRSPAVGFVRFGSLRRLSPVSRYYGFDRGLPVDRHFVEDFLRRSAGEPEYAIGLVQGRVLEIGGREYVDRFGVMADRPTPGFVHHVDVLHADPANATATIVGDLTDERALPTAAFDCIICTQTLHVIYDVRAAVRTLHGALKPGGVLLATVPGITAACQPDRDQWGDWWRFTTLSARRLLEETFPPGNVHVEAYGNVLAAVAFLHGLAAGELRPNELELRDPRYEVIIAIRATRGEV